MKITIESTDRIIPIEHAGLPHMEGRLWQGKTDKGIEVQCVIVRIATPAQGSDLSQFRSDLQECVSPWLPEAFPARMVI